MEKLCDRNRSFRINNDPNLTLLLLFEVQDQQSFGGPGGEVRKANLWRKARSTIYFFAKSLNSYLPTTFKHFPVS